MFIKKPPVDDDHDLIANLIFYGQMYQSIKGASESTSNLTQQEREVVAKAYYMLKLKYEVLHRKSKTKGT